MSRAQEVTDVATERQPVWLAGQIDEVEIDVLTRLDALTKELALTRKVLTGILIGIITASLTIPIGLIWSSAVR